MHRVLARPAAPALVLGLPEIPGLGPDEARELREIYRETDPQLRDAALLALGLRLEQGDRLEAAAGVYAAIVGGDREGPLQQGSGVESSSDRVGANLVFALPTQRDPNQNAGSASRRRAGLQLEALQGRGAFGARAEGLLRRFARQAADPRVIAPMMVGSVAFGIARNAALGRLLGSARASAFTRGWGAYLAAGGIGFGVELPAFVLSARAMGGAQRPLGQDFLGAGLTLGALKAFGWGGQAARRAAGDRVLLKDLARPLPAVAGFSGLALAHKLEEGLGLRPHSDAGTFLADTLAAYLSLGVGGRLGQALLGRRFAGRQAELQVRAERAAETRLQARLEQASARPLSRFLPMPAPAPMMIFMASPFERLFRWLEQRLYPSEGASESQSSQVTRQRMEKTMSVMLRRFPKLKKVLARSPWTLEQKWELLKAVTPNAQREPWEVFHVLPKALMAMEETGWSYERQMGLLALLSRAGEFPVPIHKHLPGALAALRACAWPQDAKFELLYSLAEMAGPHADRVYANLPEALRAMRESEWTFHEQSDLLQLLIRYADHKIGNVLLHLPPALRFMRQHEWTYAQQARLLLMIADRAPNDLQVSWMMEDHLPPALEMMAELDWNTATQSRFLTRLLDRAGEQSPVAMEFLPGLLDAMQKFGWRPDYIYETLWAVFERGGVQSGKMVEVMPLLLQTMRHRGLAMTTQREILEALAVRAGELSKFAFMHFALSLIAKPLHWKPS